MAKILVIEDDPDTRESLRSFLSSERHSVDAVETADDAVHFIKTYTYDILIVDWEMPGTSGVEFIARYRSKGGRAPVIMLTGKSATDDKISGLDHGADYYLTKPFAGKELLGFLRAALRRQPEPAGENIVFSNLTIMPGAAEVVSRNGNLSLTTRELDILRLLIENHNRIVSHDELMRIGWAEGNSVSAGTVRVFLSGLREKLQSIGAEIKIVSIRGFGYRIEKLS